MRTNQHSPKVGYLLKTYPKLSETFILNEIMLLEKLGTALHLFSLKRPSPCEKYHPAVSEIQSNVTYVLREPRLVRLGRYLKLDVRPDPLNARHAIFEHLGLFARNPVRY